MKYMLLCYDDEQAWEKAGEASLQQAMDEAVRLMHEIHAKGQYLMAAPLHPVSTATSVRVRNGKPLVTDGPFAETREQLGGFYLIDVNDVDEAIRIAQRHPGARLGTVEIRPVMEIPGLPTQEPAKASRSATVKTPNAEKEDVMQIQPYLFFEGRCEEAIEFYRKKLGAEVTMLMRFKESPDPNMCSPGSEDKVMHASFRIGDSTILASDGRCEKQANFQGFSLSLTVPNDAEAKRLFAALSDGGQVQMPLGKTFFSSSFGMVADRFGVSWMVYVAP